MGDDKFENKTVTGNKELEEIINDVSLGENETIQSKFAKWFCGYRSLKGDFVKMSIMFRPFLPRMTQKIMGEIYEFAKEYQRWNTQHKSFLLGSYRRAKFDEPDVYYDVDGEKNEERLKPLSESAYEYFFQKTFKKRHPDLWRIVQPNTPVTGESSMYIGSGDFNHQYVSVRGTKVIIEMGNVVSVLNKKISKMHDIGCTNLAKKYENLKEKALKIDNKNSYPIKEVERGDFI